MPKEFTDCNECNYLECLGLDHELNKDHKQDCEKYTTLIATGLPENACKNFIKKSYTASYFSASLELAKKGVINIRQHALFAPIYIKKKAVKK